MTGNQINYWANQEKARSNRANESIERQRNSLTNLANQIAQERNAETKRSNLKNEALKEEDLKSQVLRHKTQNVTDYIKAGSSVFSGAGGLLKGLSTVIGK